MTRIAKAKRERMDGYAKILKHHNIILSQEHLLNLDYAILHRPEGMEGNDIIDKIIEKHKKRTVKRNRIRINKCSKISGRVLATYESVTLAAKTALGNEKFKSGIVNCCAGRAKTYQGFIWQYV
jgi:hypothetical protein